MKLTEVMIIRNDGLKLFQVDDSTIAKLTRIRGNLYQDEPRLRIVKDLPTPEPKIEITPEMQARAEVAYQEYLAKRAVTTVTPAQPQPERPKTPEETWRYSPALRAEFNNNLGAYLAYCKAAKSGRCKAYGV